MFDWYETIFDIGRFALFFCIFWEAITVALSYSTFSTTAPAWLVAFISFSWERIPLVFVFALVMRFFTRSQLQTMGAG